MDTNDIAQLEAPARETTAAARMRKSRERRKDGYRVLRVEVHIDVVETLIELGYLDVSKLRDLDSVAMALARFIETVSSEVTCNAVTLDSW